LAQFRYLAFLSEVPERLVGFYEEQIGLEKMAASGGNPSLTDGFHNLAFLPLGAECEARRERGLHHLGLQVDDIDETVRRYRSFNPRGIVIEESGVAERTVRILDPEGNPLRLSHGKFGVPDDSGRYPRMIHIALNAYLPQTILDFYVEVFGFREVGQSHVWRGMGKANRFAGDGRTNLAIHPFQVDEPGHEARYGINHIGFLSRDMAARLERLADLVPIAKRPDNRPYAEYRLRDPDGNMFDLSQSKGWEIDLEKWDLVA
jgi:catechol 2,3-dioxygenase-like lactoylglutathione lyase family enzyme